MAARGVERGDAVMTLVGSRIEWVLAMLACFRMGAVAMPCNPQLRRKDLEVRVRARRTRSSASARRSCSASCPDGVPAMTMAEIAAALDEDRPQETPADVADLDAEDPAVIIFTSGTTRRAEGRALPAALSDRPATAGRALGRRPQGRARLVHRRAGLVEVDAERLHRALAPRRGGSDPRRPLRPRRAPGGSSSARASTSSARRRPSTGSSPSGPSCGRSPRCAG